MFAHTSFSYTNNEQEKLDVAGRFFSKERNTLVLHFCFVKKKYCVGVSFYSKSFVNCV